MEVILREDIDKLGNRGQVVKVAAGYARNFLLPKRLAVAATDANRKIVEQERQAHLRKEAKHEGRGRGPVQAADRRDASPSRRRPAKTTSYSARSPPRTWPTRWPPRTSPSTAARSSWTSPSSNWASSRSPVKLHKDVTAEVTVQVVKEE